MIDVIPCGCKPEKCSYKQLWFDCGCPTIVEEDVALGKRFDPLISPFLKAKYCHNKGLYRG